MKVLHISCFDSGGAGIAAVRLHKGLLSIGVESKMLVLEKRTNTPEIYQFKKTNKYYVLFQRVLKNLGLPLTLEHANDNRSRKFKGNFDYFSFARTSYTDLLSHPLVRECDIINLHWVANFLDYPSFFKHIEKPVVWTQHDMNAFQGGFHYKEDDVRNKTNLFAENDEQYQCKLSALANLASDALTVVSPSLWMMQEASASQILGRFNQVVIPNGIDPNLFNNTKNNPKTKASFGLDTKKLTVLFISESVANPRKGFDFLNDLVHDEDLRERFEFVAVGNIKSGKKVQGINYLGKIQSEQTLSELYSLVDIFLLPSREDNLPNVMLESLACGTPVVAFSVGGMPDLIKDGASGFLSPSLSSEGLKNALLQAVNRYNTFDRDAISAEFGRRYSLEVQATKYLRVYRNVKPVLVY